MPQATSYPTQPAYGAQYGVMQQVPQQAAGGYTLQGAAQQQTYYWEVPSQISVPPFVCLLYVELLNLLGYENVSLEPPHLWWFWIQCKQDASLAAVDVFIFPSAASSHWHLVWRTILQLFFFIVLRRFQFTRTHQYVRKKSLFNEVPHLCVFVIQIYCFVGMGLIPVSCWPKPMPSRHRQGSASGCQISVPAVGSQLENVEPCGCCGISYAVKYMVIAGREDFMREDDVQIGKPKCLGMLYYYVRVWLYHAVLTCKTWLHFNQLLGPWHGIGQPLLTNVHRPFKRCWGRLMENREKSPKHLVV